ncbi:hypothetical protein CYMTET_34077 [Cymbomonas tetramitiformis]|uniref:Uncharacterized protein n=1 Tax=Cymbomonas tetramitiformis TaxID=36881 RepID=A0AAE0FBN9_9CHLO|nr:hypothetical protein CYMTET_34077 [Cymbomonas tetramitiformis]
MVLCYCGYGLSGFGHMFGLALASFVITKIIPRKHAGFAVFGVSFAHLTTCHVLNASGASWNAGNIDFTGSQMVLVLKVSGVAFNYMDGLLAYQDMSAWQKQAHLKDLPSLLEFMGYVFDPSTVLVGPAIDFWEYLEFAQDRAGKGLTKQPGFMLRALQNFLGNLLCLALNLVGSSRFPVSLIGSPEWYSEFTLWYKLFVLYAIALQSRMKYYFVWGLGHTSMIASGSPLTPPLHGPSFAPLTTPTAPADPGFTNHT